LLAVFVVACLFQAVSAVGFSQLAARTHRLFQRLFKTAEAQKLRDLKAEILSLKNDISRTSAQDEFAKWAKMRRQYDKLLSNFEQAAKERASKKSSFEFMMSWGLWILFWVLQILFIIVWRKEAMFYIPRDWVGPFSSWLRFPFAPAG
ncbi:WRB/Get1 family, partial [Entophlyctis helioformis]